jgi:hypothetical protein
MTLGTSVGARVSDAMAAFGRTVEGFDSSLVGKGILGAVMEGDTLVGTDLMAGDCLLHLQCFNVLDQCVDPILD